MPNNDCPLCHSKKHKTLEKINLSQIEYLWKILDVNLQSSIKNNLITKEECLNCKLTFFKPNFSGDSCFYNQINQKKWYYSSKGRIEFDYCKSIVNNREKVLDVGCGKGELHNYLNEKKVTYTGLELSSKAVCFGKEKGICILNKTLEEFSYNKNLEFDKVFSLQILEHVTNIESFAQSINKILKKKGLWIIAVPNNDSFIGKATNCILNYPPHHTLHWTEESLRNLASKYNFIVEGVFKEKVSSIHKRFYYTTKLYNCFITLIGRKYKSIDTNIIFIVLNKIFYKIAPLFYFLNIHKNKDGHTIIMTLRKS